MDTTFDLSIGSVIDDGLSEYHEAVLDVHRYLEKTTAENATEKPTKPGILRRIWNAIVKCFKYIANKLKAFYRMIKSKFTSKKNGTQTASGVAAECNIKPSNTNVAKAKPAVKFIDQQGRQVVITNPYKKIANAFKDHYGVAGPIKNESVSVYTENAVAIAQELEIIFLQSGNIKFQVAKMPLYGAGDVVGPGPTGAARRALGTTLYLMRDSHAITVLENYIQRLYELVKNPSAINHTMLNSVGKQMNRQQQQISTTITTTTEVSIAQIKNFSTKFDKLNNDMIGSIDTVLLDKVSQEYNILETVNLVFNIVNAIQMSINFISNAMDNAAIIGDQYCGAITNINDLDLFVSKSIKYGIPPKYIAYNVAVLTNSGDKDHPMMGQSRVVFIGDGKAPFSDTRSVYKIAMNPMGYRSNQIEKKVSDEFRQMNAIQYLAAVKNLTAEKCVLEMERAKDIGTVDGAKVINLRQEIANVLSQHNKTYELSDIHQNNVAVPYKSTPLNAVIIDYGWVKKS